jgi:hypothetical protein
MCQIIALVTIIYHVNFQQFSYAGTRMFDVVSLVIIYMYGTTKHKFLLGEQKLAILVSSTVAYN